MSDFMSDGKWIPMPFIAAMFFRACISVLFEAIVVGTAIYWYPAGAGIIAITATLTTLVLCFLATVSDRLSHAEREKNVQASDTLPEGQSHCVGCVCHDYTNQFYLEDEWTQ